MTSCPLQAVLLLANEKEPAKGRRCFARAGEGLHHGRGTEGERKTATGRAHCHLPVKNNMGSWFLWHSPCVPASSGKMKLFSHLVLVKDEE